MTINNIRIGTTSSWEYSDPQRKPPEWSITYYFVKDDGSAKVEIPGTASGDKYTFTIDIATSQLFSPGSWSYIAIATSASESVEVDSGVVTVLPDPSASDVSAFQSHTKKVLDILQAALEGRASRTDLEYQIGNRKIKHMSAREIYRLWKIYKIMYEQERRAAKLGEHMGPGIPVYVRFKGE